MKAIMGDVACTGPVDVQTVPHVYADHTLR